MPGSVQDQASALGITLNTRPWPWSLEQVTSSAQLLDSATDLYAPSGFQIADVVGLDPSFTGITIEGSFPDSVSNTDPLIASITTQAERLTGIPIRVTTGITSGAASGRDNDTSPFYAGG